MLSKNDFPIFDTHPNLIYLDAAATAQIPTGVLEVVDKWYSFKNANVHRGLYSLSISATDTYERARHSISNFLHIKPTECVFVRNTTEGMNSIARAYAPFLKPNHSIIISELEHHSTLLVWRTIAKETGASFKIIPVHDGRIRLSDAKNVIDSKTSIVIISHVSNVFGATQPVKEIADYAHTFGATVVIDGAQAVAHMPVHPWELGADAYVFSGHKMYAPHGIGVVCITEKKLAQRLDHFLLGGEMVESVTADSYKLKSAPRRFEAGTPNASGAVGLGRAFELLHDDNNWKHLNKLSSALFRVIQQSGATLYSPQDGDIPLVSFNFNGIHPDTIALALSENDIAVRSGYLCAQPMTSKLNASGVVRASAGLWNTNEDIEKFGDALKKIANRSLS